MYEVPRPEFEEWQSENEQAVVHAGNYENTVSGLIASGAALGAIGEAMRLSMQEARRMTPRKAPKTPEPELPNKRMFDL
jgi:hypothetical protein